MQVTGKLKRYGNIGLFADGETIVQVTGKLKRCGNIGLFADGETIVQVTGKLKRCRGIGLFRSQGESDAAFFLNASLGIFRQWYNKGNGWKSGRRQYEKFRKEAVLHRGAGRRGA